MKYEMRMVNVDGIGKPSMTPISAKGQQEACAKFKRIRLAHGDESVLQLKLFEINNSGQETDITPPQS